MTDTTQTTPPVEAKPKHSKIWSYLAAIVSFVLAAIALIRFFDTSLPDCTSSRTSTTLTSILSEKNVTGATLSDKREVAKDPNEIRCTAQMATTDGARFNMTYRIYRGDDGKTMVAAEWRRL